MRRGGWGPDPDLPMKLGELEAPGIYQGDCRELLEKLPDESVQCVVTSPPYWGLRSYEGNQALVWGGDPGCDHQWLENERQTTPGGSVGATAKVGTTRAGVQRGTVLEAWCEKCGAWRGPYGNEPRLEMYLEHTMEILGRIHRVLKPDGVVFWNIGDSYITHAYDRSGRSTDPKNRGRKMKGANRLPQKGLKHKDLALIPHRVALGAQEQGWWVRSDIIWAKGASFGPFVGNAMPEPVEDRPTTAHEHVLMLTKSVSYYWDKKAVAEEAVTPKRKAKRDWDRAQERHKYDEIGSRRMGASDGGDLETRNLRTVWTIPTKAYKDAHFATFPPALPEVCVKAASRKGDVVLDPFCGSGTTLLVADGLDRVWLGFDTAYSEVCEGRLGPLVVAMARERLG